MSRQQREYYRQSTLAFHAGEVQYLILYTSPVLAKLLWCYTWSSESLDKVRDLFLSDFHEERPVIRMLMPVHDN